MKSLLLLTLTLSSFAASPVPISESMSRINQKFRAGIASLQYPHAIEDDGRLLIALSRLKTQIEVFSVTLDDGAALLKTRPSHRTAPFPLLPTHRNRNQIHETGRWGQKNPPVILLSPFSCLYHHRQSRSS